VSWPDKLRVGAESTRQHPAATTAGAEPTLINKEYVRLYGQPLSKSRAATRRGWPGARARGSCRGGRPGGRRAASRSADGARGDPDDPEPGEGARRSDQDHLARSASATGRGVVA
jgi:hypothetical protein